MEGRLWQNVGRLIEDIDYKSESGAIQFCEAIVQFMDSCTYEELSEKIDPLICADRRRYSIGYRTWPPLGYYEPSEAMVLATTNVSRGRLLKRAANPSYIYEHDENGQVLRISQMHSYEHLKGKPSSIAYCLREGENEYYMIFECSYEKDGEASRREAKSLESMIVVLREKDARVKYIWRAASTKSRIMALVEIEAYGEISNDLQKIERHTVYVCFEERKKAFGWQKFAELLHFDQENSIHTKSGWIRYDDRGAMSECWFDT